MPGKYRNIIFDLDGTLVDSSGDIGSCLSLAFSGVSAGGADSGIERAWLGLPLRDIVVASNPSLDEAGVRRVCDRFRELYDGSDYPATTLMPGVAGVLETLTRGGKQLFIATNKPAKPTMRILGLLGISREFKDVVCPDILPGERMTKPQMLGLLLKKWGFERGETLMVGDSEQDILAARENRIHCAYYTGGYGERAKAEGLCPEIVFDEMTVLETLV